jgi:soluble lytic murein transglycosylase-like protein
MDATAQARLAIVQKWAVKHSLDPVLVCALVEQESGWNTFAIRWEPVFYTRYVVPLRLPDATEATCRSISWGYCQVMGQVAREHGFTGRFLSQLCDPDTGLDVGCAVLASKIDKAGSIEAGLLAYNGGGNPEYPAQVLARKVGYETS